MNGIPFSVQTAMGSSFYSEEVKTRKTETFKLQDFHFIFLNSSMFTYFGARELTWGSMWNNMESSTEFHP